MTFLAACLGRRRLVLATVGLLSAAGVLSWMTMPREEDPQFPHRNGLILAAFPGADAATVERLVVEPIEEHLVEVEGVHEILSTSRAGVAIVRVKLGDTVYATDEAWDEVDEALDAARRDFPSGVQEPTLDHDLVSQEAVVLALTGSSDPVELADAAEGVRRRLLGLTSVKRVEVIADPKEQITVEYDEATARRLGLDPRLLGLQLAARSSIVPGGMVHLGSKTANLRPITEFQSLEELASTPIVLPSGAGVELSQLATVRRGPREPVAERMRWNGTTAVGLGVVPRDGIDRVAFGAEVRAAVASIREDVAPLAIEEAIFQPDQVQSRLRQLSRSLLLGVLVVAGVLFAFMGARLGTVVALVVPLVTFTSIGLFDLGGGILHQISIAAVVIALGMLVDNAIVMAEAIQWRIDRGEPAGSAAQAAVRELATPLASATGTTLAAFVPMLLSQGNTADFTRALPILIMLTLVVSYLFAVLVTPVLSGLFLRPRTGRPESRGTVPGVTRLARFAVAHSGWVLLGALGLVVASGVAAGWVDQQFFPAADREILVVDLTLPEGTHLDETDLRARRLEAALAEREEARSVLTFVGRAAPHFYYNLLSRPASPHRAQLVVEATDLPAVESLMAWTREYAARELPEAEVVARRLEQGPPIEAPVELRLVASRLGELRVAADDVLALLRDLPGTRDVRHDLGLGTPTVRFAIDDAAAARHGVDRTDVALALLGRTLGQEIGQYRMDEDPVPIFVRSREGEDLPADRLETIDVAVPGGPPVSLSQVARLEASWQPAAIRHRNGERVVHVRAQLEEGVTAHQVLAELELRRDELALTPTVRLEIGGEAEESGAANQAILGAAPLGALLLLFFLLAEFNSFRRVGIVLVTVPLAATGVVPGLLLTGQPFGFMSLLGVVALVGIVVNNAIVLLDVVERRREEGISLEEALVDAVERRARPILLTSVTTIAGLLPLALSGTSLWPPLAWAMISGLFASTLLTLAVVPALYRLFLGGPRRGPVAATGLVGLLLVGILGAAPARAGELPGVTFEEAFSRAAEAPAPRAAADRAEAARRGAQATWRTAVWPTLGLSGEADRRSDVFALETPVGPFQLGEKSAERLGVRLVQPLLDPVTLFYSAPAAREEANAAGYRAERAVQERQAAAAGAFLDVLGLRARFGSTETFVAALEARLAEARERVAAGRSLATDAQKIQLDLESARLDRARLVDALDVAAWELGRQIGAEGAVAALEPLPFGSPTIPAEAELVVRGRESRADVAAADAALRALDRRVGAVRAELYPRLEGEVQWVRSEGDPFVPEELTTATLRLSWAPFAAATRAPRAAAAQAERSALAHERDELLRSLAVEVRAARADWEQAVRAVEVRRRGLALAEETARVERERHRAGRSTTNDLLDAEASVRLQSTLFRLSELAVVAARVKLGLGVGDPRAFLGIEPVKAAPRPVLDPGADRARADR